MSALHSGPILLLTNTKILTRGVYFATRHEQRGNKASVKAKPIIYFGICGSPNAGVSQIVLPAAILESFSSRCCEIALTTVEQTAQFSLEPRAPVPVRSGDSSLRKRKRERERKKLSLSDILV